jgi:hypothetical protein
MCCVSIGSRDSLVSREERRGEEIRGEERRGERI